MSSGRPLATIVIVNYNYGQYVAAAINSALAQTYSAVQVVVVDDGSTDDSRKVIASFGNRIETVLQRNAGQGSAYNAGWRVARGEFVLFLDSDDLLTSDSIEKIAAAFALKRAVKVQFYLRQVDRYLKPLGYLLPSHRFPPLEVRDQITNYGYYVCPPASGNAFRKKFLDEIMPIADEELYRRAADGYTTGLAGIAGTVVSLPFTLGLYRVHGDNGGGEGGVKSVQTLHHMFMRDIKREESQHEFGTQFNFHFSADRSRFCPGHTKLRLLSRRLLAGAHPIKTDRVSKLMFSGVASAIRYPHLKLRQRFVVGLGFLALGLAPRSLLLNYFHSIVAPQTRNRAA